MRLGVFGGTFDPVHYGHLLLAESCREQLQLDQVWFLPAAVPPHKQQNTVTCGEQRIEMLELAIAGYDAFRVCDYEVTRGGVNYTVDTLEHLHAEDPTRQLFFLMGADALLDLPTWKEPVRLCELATPVVVCRGEFDRPEGSGPSHDALLELPLSPRQIEAIQNHQVRMPRIDLSSREIRAKVASGHSIRYRTPRAVEKYIETHGLYRE